MKNADETAEILTSIVSSMDKMNDLVSEIASSSNEQNSGIGEVNVGLTQVNTVVQQNASISKENASASQELKSQVDQLLRLTEGIQVTEDIGDEKPVQEEVKIPEVPKVTAPQQPKVREVKAAQTPKQITLDDENFGKY